MGLLISQSLHRQVPVLYNSTPGNVHFYAAAATASEASKPENQGFVAKQRASFKSLVTPFSDPAVNAKLVSLCFASALCSVATLIHDTYLPIYLSEQLGLSNTKVRLLLKRCTFGMVISFRPLKDHII